MSIVFWSVILGYAVYLGLSMFLGNYSNILISVQFVLDPSLKKSNSKNALCRGICVVIYYLRVYMCGCVRL